MDKPDVIIVGAGMGGLITGGILAKKDNMKVLVLEKAKAIGGRTLSFGGPHGIYTEDEYRKTLWEGAGIRIIKTEPSLAEIIDKKGLFTNYITDGGWHGMSAGTRNRFSIIAKALGKEVRVGNQVGLSYYHNGEWVEMAETVKDWPVESMKERSRVARERLMLSLEQSEEYDHIDMEAYMGSVTQDQRVRDYYIDLAKFQFGINDATEISAGEWIKCNNMTSAAGGHLSRGGGMGDVEGGFKRTSDVFAEIIMECGGEVRTNAKVKEVIIKDGEAKGVVVEQDGKTSTIEASAVVSNLPMNMAFDIIQETYFPKELKQRMKNLLPNSGICGTLCLKELLETKLPAGMFVLDHLPGPKLKGGLPPFGFEQTSVIDPTRILKEGSGHLIQTWIALWVRDPDEIHDEKLLNGLIDAQLDFFRKQYPQFDKILDWYMFIVPEMLNLSPTPGYIGNRRFSVKHPLIKNLYFTGDTITQWDVGVSGTAHGAVICAGAVSGRDHMTMLPPYMR